MGGGGLLGLKELRRNFLLWGHLAKISFLWLRLVFGSASRMATFSLKHKSHWRLPLENAWALALMDHSIFGFESEFLHFQIYVESVVEFAFEFLKVCLWPLNLFLNVSPVCPM